MPITPPFPHPQATRLVENVRAKILGTSLPSVQAELFTTERDFCDFTNVWQEDIDIPVVANVTTYQIVPAAGSIIRLLNVYNSTDADKKLVAACGMRIPGTVVFRRAPNEEATWVATVSKVPIDPTDIQNMPIIDDWIVTKYYDALENGVIGRLHLSASKPYFNDKAGAFHTKVYNRARSNARVEVLHQNDYGAQSWTYPQSYGVSRPQRGV